MTVIDGLLHTFNLSFVWVKLLPVGHHPGCNVANAHRNCDESTFTAVGKYEP